MAPKTAEELYFLYDVQFGGNTISVIPQVKTTPCIQEYKAWTNECLPSTATEKKIYDKESRCFSLFKIWDKCIKETNE